MTDPRLGVSGSGYAEIVVGRDRVYIHRLVAYSHGELDHLYERRDIHHEDGCKWNNAPENLRRTMPDIHRAAHVNGGEV